MKTSNKVLLYHVHKLFSHNTVHKTLINCNCML